MKLTSFLYELLFNIKIPHKSPSQEELFHTDIFLRPNKINFKTCPRCKKEAKTNKDIIDFFGIKRFNEKIQIQSWCKECRTELNPNKQHKSNQQEIV